MNSSLLCIIGQTATGKTDLALNLAKKFDGELIACDTRQVYKGLDLGSGKEDPSEYSIEKGQGFWIVGGVKLWQYDVADPKNKYSIANYIHDSKIVISKIAKENKLPIVVGGAGFYLNGLLNGIDTANVGPDEEIRKVLEKKPLEDVQKKLQELSPVTFESLNNSEKNNSRRLIRKIEILEGLRVKGEGGRLEGIVNGFGVLKIGLTAPKEILNERIEKRVIKRVNQGMLDEAKVLHYKGLSLKRMRELGLEYGVMADFLEGKFTSEEEFTEVLSRKIKQFAKGQMTWFKRDREIIWVDITEKRYLEKVEKLVHNWYNSE